MSDYRPWAPQVEGPSVSDAPPVESDAPEASTADDAPYAPWQRPERGTAAAAPPTKDFEAPPGLAAAAPRRDGARGMRVAGALLLWAGGFLLIAGVAGAAWTGGLASFMEASGAAHDPGAIREARAWQTASLAIGFVAGIPALVAGVGILYRRPWALATGVAAASLQLLVVPFGTLLGIVALALLLRPQARWWFR